MKTICFSSLKGGSGKSSLSVLAAERLQRLGKRVLCLDLDIQNSLSYQFTKGMTQIHLEKNAWQGLLDGRFAPHIQNAGRGPDFIISDLRLLDLQEKITPRSVPHALSGLGDLYDFLIIDSAPTYNTLVASAYCASDTLVIPVELSLFDVKSLHFLFAKLRDLSLGRLSVTVLVNKADAPGTDPALTKEYLALVEEHFGKHLLETRVPYSPHIRTYLDTGKAIPKGPVTKSIDRLVDHLLENAA